MRIDVALRPDDFEADLDKQYRRLHSPGDALHGIATLAMPLPGLALRHRQADGEHYVYVEDVVHQRLAGYTVFNRLVEVSRRADPHLRGPHSKYATGYQRRGIATAVYEWALGAGICLISGARQSVAAHALWRALAQRHSLLYVGLRDKALRQLGAEVEPAVFDDLHTRMVLLGRGWSAERFAAAVAEPRAANSGWALRPGAVRAGDRGEVARRC